MSAEDGLVVVVPRARDARRVPEVLEAHSAWIERADARMAQRREWARVGEDEVPEAVECPAFGVARRVVRQDASGATGVRAAERDGEIRLSGNTDEAAACRAALRRWLTAKAKALLVPEVERLALGGERLPTRVTVRAQRTRWGSCSSAGAISLNRNLLFLEPDVTRYVILHELAHLEVPDHSARFWAALGRAEPRADALRRTLRHAWRSVPAWASERDDARERP